MKIKIKTAFYSLDPQYNNGIFYGPNLKVTKKLTKEIILPLNIAKVSKILLESFFNLRIRLKFVIIQDVCLNPTVFHNIFFIITLYFYL